MIPTEAQRLMQDSARRFAEAEIRPHVRDWERDGTVPREVLRKMGQLGLMGMLISQALGGSGADFVSYVLATEEIAAADCGLCNMMNVNKYPSKSFWV
jgi:butyryl-CoA dehydrogenase